MKLPKQIPAVERKVNKHAVAQTGKVNPSAWWEDVIRAAPSVISTLGSIF